MAHFSMPEHVLIGSNAMEEALGYISGYGKHALIVSGPHVAKSPMMESLVQALSEIKMNYTIFSDITGEPTNDMIAQGVEVYKEKQCDFIIGIGGGSPLDSAKAIAVMQMSSGDIADYMGQEIDLKIPPIVAIPTTAGTGSETTKFTVITDSKTDIKMLLKGECLIPKLVVLNYEYTFDMPRSVTAATGLDALTHAIEAYTSKKAFPLTDSYAVSAVKRIMKYLPIAYKDGENARAREEMMLAAFEAGVCINNSSVTLVHGMSRPIGALFHIPHGKSNAMLLQDCLGFALDGAYDRFATLGRECKVALLEDTDETASVKFLTAVCELVRTCEIDTLTAAGIDPVEFVSKIEKMAEDAVASGSPANTRKTVLKEDCIDIYRKAIER